MRSISWITLLVSLFIFQSLWNVAAAFCLHEDVSSLSVQTSHFGHHQTKLCAKTTHQNTTDQNLKNKHSKEQADQNTSTVLLAEDHQDHLPSMTYIILQKEKILVDPLHLEIKETHQFNWQNHYQPPDLSQHRPPPEYTPLMVG